MKRYKETVIEEIQYSELDLDPPFYDETGIESNVVETAENIWAEVPSIDLDLIIKTLTDLKEKGATRVYVYAHVDHMGYIFTGTKIEEVND